MDICLLEKLELEPKFHKYKGRVVLRGDMVKDGSGVIARLPDCDGQAADAVSAYTQVKMKDAPILLRIPRSKCHEIWMRLPRHRWPKSWMHIKDTVVPLERYLCGHPLAGLLWVRNLAENLL